MILHWARIRGPQLKPLQTGAILSAEKCFRSARFSWAKKKKKNKNDSILTLRIFKRILQDFVDRKKVFVLVCDNVTAETLRENWKPGFW